MKKSKLILGILLPLAALLLSACSSVVSGTSWPGVTVNEDTIYVAYMNHVYAVKASDGSMIWRYPEKATQTTYFAAPALAGDQIIVGDYSNVLHSLDAATGAENWTFTGATNDWTAGVLVVNDTILAPNSDHHLYALDLNGQLKWSFETKRANWSKPVSDGDVVYLASMDHMLYAIDLATGKEKWSAELTGAVPYSPTLGEDGRLYVATLARTVEAVDAATGDVVWTKSFDSQLWTQPLVYDGNLYFGELNGNVIIASTTDGTPIKTITIGEPITGLATVVGDNIVFSTEDGSLVAMTAAGERTWSNTYEGPLYTGPVVLNDQLALGISNKETFLRLLNASGQGVWTFTAPK